MLYIGCDVGKKGGVSIVNSDGVILESFEYSEDIQSMITILKEATKGRRCQAIIEKVSAMPGQGVTSMFNFGTNYGIWQGIFYALGIPFELVRPQAWQKVVGIPAKSDKKAIAQFAQRLYPTAELYTPRGRLKDGISDSLMMAHYAKLKY